MLCPLLYLGAMSSGSMITGFACGQAEALGISPSIAGSPQVLPGKMGRALRDITLSTLLLPYLLQKTATGECLQLPQAREGMGVSGIPGA